MRALRIGALATVIALALVALPQAGAASAVGSGASVVGAVFDMTNNATHNQVVVYDRWSGGALTWAGSYATGGTGTGGSLADQGSLAVSSDGRWLLAVDAGSNQISVFRVHLPFGGGPDSLTLTDVVSSRGAVPVSVSAFGNLVYVLNVGNSTTPGNIAGFVLWGPGHLAPVGGSIRPLSTSAATAAAQISFSPSGEFLVVSEKNTNLLDVYAVHGFGGASGPTSFRSAGTTPYGFAFDHAGRLYVSEASTGSVSSYALGWFGKLHVISGAVPDTQGAPCWVVVSAGVVYTSNAHSNSISSYQVGPRGTLTLLHAVAGSTDGSPTDMALADHGRVLYVFDAGAREIQAFGVNPGGTLTWLETVGGLPASSEGLVAL